MLRIAVIALGLSGCASGVCDDCPSVTLSVNGASEVTAATGTPLTYTWSSTNADSATSTVTVEPVSPDACGIVNGPWVVHTVAGTSEPVPLASCQAGSTYTLVVTVAQATTGESASAQVVVIAR